MILIVAIALIVVLGLALCVKVIIAWRTDTITRVDSIQPTAVLIEKYKL